jgi:hypothetical protein
MKWIYYFEIWCWYGESMLKYVQKVVCLKFHLKIWKKITIKKESKLESFLSFILKTFIPTLGL